jgi:hypothetical protein
MMPARAALAQQRNLPYAEARAPGTPTTVNEAYHVLPLQAAIGWQAMRLPRKGNPKLKFSSTQRFATRPVLNQAPDIAAIRYVRFCTARSKVYGRTAVRASFVCATAPGWLYQLY